MPDPKLGPRKVDIANLYSIERFRPNYSDKLGAPLFLSAVRTAD
jgi:6-phosphofructokinase 1